MKRARWLTRLTLSTALLASCAGCTNTDMRNFADELVTFVQDFLRQILAAFLL